MSHEQKARVTDSISHGGSIIEGSPTVHCNQLPVARVGDACICDIHGLVYIKTGSCKVRSDGHIPQARRNIDITSCDAKITSGSPDTYLEDSTICES